MRILDLKLSHEPPWDWRKRLQQIIKKHDLLLISAGRDAPDRISVRLDSKLPLFTGDPTQPTDEQVRLVEQEALEMLEDPPTRGYSATRALTLSTLALGCAAALLAALRVSQYAEIATISTVFGAAAAIIAGVIATQARQRATEEVSLRQEELFARLSATTKALKDEELIRAAISIRARSTQADLDKFWSRSRAAFFFGSTLLLLALAGPVVAFYFAIDKNDWHYLLGSASVSVVTLVAGAAFLRHDNKLRAQYQASKCEIAYFDRLQVAIDCSRALSEETYRQTLATIVGHLVTEAPALVSAEDSRTEQEAEPITAIADRVIESSTRLAEKAIEAATPKK